MKWSQIVNRLKQLGIVCICVNRPEADPEITSVHYRADAVTPGGLFVAVQGHVADGHAFIGQALERGAAALIVEKEAGIATDAPVLRVDHGRRALAASAAAFYGHPSEKLVMIGITGTNGKTTTACLIEAILKQRGISTGVIGTINYRYGGRDYPNPLTTPESLEIQKILADMAEAGVTHVIMEVSSHGIALDRVFACRFDVRAFTNLTRDHLDFHGTMAAYGGCKRRFITGLSGQHRKSGAVAVINTHDPFGRELAERVDSSKRVTVGMGSENDVYSKSFFMDQNGIRGVLATPSGECPFSSALAGRFNLENILCAAGIAHALGTPPAGIRKGIEAFTRVPGRLEKIGNTARRHVYVDYAHTPDAMENVLSTLRDLAAGRLICVFGCGGDRDRGKRPKMGEVAARLADLVVITSDNPRTEDPAAIIADIRQGVNGCMPELHRPGDPDRPEWGGGYIVEPDRKKAIHLAIDASREEDTILIAGKGHEPYQIIGRTMIEFDDRTTAALAMTEKGWI